jgi:hypothetical protein
VIGDLVAGHRRQLAARQRARAGSIVISTGSMAISRRSASARRRLRATPRTSPKLLCAKIETIEPGLGIEAMTLVAPLIEPWRARARAWRAWTRRGPDLAALVDTLANRFGNAACTAFRQGQRDARALGRDRPGAGAGAGA